MTALVDLLWALIERIAAWFSDGLVELISEE